MTRGKTCFVIAPIGDPDSAIRKRSDQILKHIIHPVVVRRRYQEPVRADSISTPGLITTQVIEHVVEADLVIADLTGHNPNVFYELALRHATRKPFIQLIEEGERIPFDVSASRTIIVDHRDLDKVEQAKEELDRQIQSLEKEPNKVDNPISTTFDLKALYKSEDPEDRSLAELMTSVTSISSSLQDLKNRLIAFERIRVLDTLVDKLARIEKSSDELERFLGINIYDVGDIMSKLDEIETSVGRVESSVDNIGGF